MPWITEFWDRFRPAGVAGPPTRAGVPADRAAESEAELAGVLAALAETQRTCAAIIAAAERDAGAVRAHAAEDAEALVGRARAARSSVRARYAAQTGDADEEAARSTAVANDRAAAARRNAERQIPDVVERAVADVRALAEVGGVTARPGTAPVPAPEDPPATGDGGAPK